MLLCPLIVVSTVSNSQITRFKLTDVGGGLSGGLIIGERIHNYSSYFNKSDLSNAQNSETQYAQSIKNERIVTPAKSFLGQVTFTQLAKCSRCLAKKAKAIRISVGYGSQLLLQPLMRTTDLGSSITQVDRIGRSRLRSVISEVEVRRIFANTEDDFRIFVGLGLLADFSFQHKAKITSVSYEHVQKTVAIHHPSAPAYYYQYEEKRPIRHETRTIELANSSTAGAFLCTGLYWPASDRLALELEVKVGKLAHRLRHADVNVNNFSSVGVNFRFLL